MKAAIESSDSITTVSPSYAGEILTPEYGCGMEGFLHDHASKISGIVNGLNIDEWNPLTDRLQYRIFLTRDRAENPPSPQSALPMLEKF